MRVTAGKSIPVESLGDALIASLDAVLVDPTTSKVVWETHRPVKPVQLHAELFGGQADVVAAQELMHEVFASLGP